MPLPHHSRILSFSGAVTFLTSLIVLQSWKGGGQAWSWQTSLSSPKHQLRLSQRRGHPLPLSAQAPREPFSVSSPNHGNRQRHLPSWPRQSSRRAAATSSFALYAQQQPSNNDATSTSTISQQTPRVYPQRWVQLAYLSLLALLSDWICFSVAAAPDTYEQVYQHSAASLIDLFLFTNVASCFLVTDIVAKIGLQSAIQGSALLMTLGCWLRSGLSFLPFVGDAHSNSLVSYPLLVLGTVCVGAAQPFFQCTPPMLSATWFAPSERATATAVALNFNQIGIATAFLVGGHMAVDRSGLSNYFGLMAVLCTVVAIGTVLQFQNEPAIPPSASEMEKKLNVHHQEPPFLESAQRFFKTRGFTPALAAFVCSISITNIVGTFIDEIMERGGITEQLSIDLAGAGFELAILMGGILIGGYVDKTKQYKKVTLACLALTAITVIPLGLTDHALGQEPLLLLAALLGLGLAAGPVQPINAELAVDVTYPCDETAVESVQQVGGNMISALLIPIAEWASHADVQLLPNIPMLASDVRGDVILLLFVALLTMAYFNTFDAPLARSMADHEGANTDVKTAASSVTIDVVSVPVPAGAVVAAAASEGQLDEAVMGTVLDVDLATTSSSTSMVESVLGKWNITTAETA